MGYPSRALDSGASQARSKWVTVGLFLSLLALTLASAGVTPAAAACADTIIARAARTYSMPSSATVTYVEACTLSAVPGRRFLIEVLRPGGSNPLTSARVAYAGVEYFGSGDVSAADELISRVAVPQGASNLKVTLQGSAGARVVIRVTHVPEPLFQIYGSGNLTGNSNNALSKTYTKYFTPADGVPATPHVMRITNGAADSTGASRATDAEVFLNSGGVVWSGELNAGVAALTRDIGIEPTNTVEVTIPPGNAGKKLSIVVYGTDNTPPEVFVIAPGDSFVTRGPQFVAAVQPVDPQTGVRLWANGEERLLANGIWSDSIALPAQDGLSTHTFVAENGACLVDTVRLTVIRDTQPPTVEVLAPAPNYTEVASNSAQVQFRLRVADATRTRVWLDDTEIGALPLLVGVDTLAANVNLDMGPNGVLVRATDAAGNTTEFKHYVFRSTGEGAHQDSNVGETPIALTEVGSFRDQISFLFQGADPVQTITNPTAIAAGREAVLRGYVVARDFGPLPNVKVTVKDHPEFGWTESREDGRFDLVVSGGETYTLRFTLNEFLESQRQVLAPPLDYALLDTVAMIGRSQRWYYADTSQTWRIVGRFESDANGDRYMYLHVPHGALATVTPVGGAPATFDKYRIRLKEFTVGSGGRDAMPGALPPTTAYTYCVDMSLVEADSILDHHFAGGTAPEITFSKPIVTYVREFLGLPVGTAVPSGYYSPARGAWVADPDGVILKVLSIGGGYATLDTDGDGQADNATKLASAGIDSLELGRMAANFAQNDILWRVPVTHFSSHDYNYNYGSDPDATGPAAAGVGPGVPPIGDPDKTCNCVIENENRVLGESIPVSGTPYTLNYRSNRVPGDRASYWLRVPLTGATVPTGLSRVHLTVDVVGKHFEKIYSGLGPNEWRMFTDWDGRDGNNRRVPGSVTATVRIGYEFRASYSTVKSGGGSGWGNSASTATRSGAAATGDRDGGNISWSTQKVSLGAPSMASAGLGGWTLSPHHFYDPSGHGALFFGDGSTRYGEARRPVITKFAGNGYWPSGLPNGQSKLSLGLFPSALTMGPDGSLFAVCEPGPYIVRIRPDGTMITWAGSTQGGSPSDTVVSGRLATTVKFVGTLDIAAGPDGSLFVSDANFRQVYRISPTDTIYVLAGHYQAGYGTFVDGSVAVSSVLHSPTAVAVDRDGSVLVADDGWHRIVRLTTGGLIRGVAGNGQTTPIGSAGKADSLAVYGSGGYDVSDMAVDAAGNIYFLSEHLLYVIRPDGQMKRFPAQGPFIDHQPTYLALGPDGAFYIGQSTLNSWNGVYRLEPDRMSVTRLAGGYNMSAESGTLTDFDNTEGVHGIAAVLNNVTGLAVGPDGAVYVSETRPNAIGGKCRGIRRIAPELPGTSLGEVVYPSQDGREVYYFTPSGRHLRTKDAWTGVTLYTFGYNAAGQLTSVTDVNALVTQIIRDANGNPKAIAGHFGHRDTLAFDANGYLSLVRNELSNEQYVLTHNPDGLLEAFQNPRGKTQQFHYRTGSPGSGMGVQGDGRLETDTDAALADITMGYSVQDTLRTVTRTTELGRTTTYQITEYMNGLRRRLTRYPDNTYRYRTDSTNTAAAPYGSVRREVGPSGEESLTYPRRDSRFGMLAQVPAVLSTKLPSGRTRRLTFSREYTGTGRVTESSNLNSAGTSYVSVSDSTASGQTALMTSPRNRRMTVWFDPAARPSGVKVGGLSLVSLEYDAYGRLSTITQGTRSWHYGYNPSGRLSSFHNALGHTTTMLYDAAGRDTSQILPGGRVIGLRYDASGNLTSVRPPGRPLHQFGYTDVGLNESYTPPQVPGVGTATTTYYYNPDRQLSDVTRPDGSTLHLEYDATTGRLTSIAQPRGTSQLTYWDTPQPGTTSRSGQLKTVTSPDGVTSTYEYDGPLLRSETWSGAVVGNVAITYDNNFRDATEKVTVGLVSSEAKFSYDDDGLLTRAESVPSGWVFDVHRADSTGLADSTHVGAGAGVVTSSAGYNGFGELSELHYSLAGNALFHQSIHRNVLGLVTRIEESWNGGMPRVIEYGHDLAGRLDSVAVDGVITQTLQYDHALPGNGNRTRFGSAAGDTASYDYQDRMLSYGTASYVYTANGAVAARIVAGVDTTRYTYDALGNLTGAHMPGVSGDSLVYLIDGQNRRVGLRRNGSSERQWLYAGGVSPIAELSGSGELMNRFLYATTGHSPDLVVRGDTAYRVITDQLGSVRAVVRTTDGMLVQRTDYDAWGAISADSGGSFQSLGYAGGLTDRTTGLIRFGARDYDPSVGRWTDKDHNGSPETGLYAYASNSPTELIDVTGLSPVSADGGGHLSPDDLRRSAVCTGTLIGKTIRGRWERYHYYKDMVAAKRSFDIAGNMYGEGLSEAERKALGNELAGELAAALGIPLSDVLTGATVYHYIRAYRKKELMDQIRKAIESGSLDVPGDEEETTYGYLQYGALYRRLCECEAGR